MGRGCTRPQTVQGNSTLQHVGVQCCSAHLHGTSVRAVLSAAASKAADQAIRGPEASMCRWDNMLGFTSITPLGMESCSRALTMLRNHLVYEFLKSP